MITTRHGDILNNLGMSKILINLLVLKHSDIDHNMMLENILQKDKENR